MDAVDFTDEQVLDALDEERRRFDRADKGLMQHYIDALVERGVYPRETVSGNPNSVRAMVEGYGARWHLWREPLACPHCGADLRNHVTGPPYKREIVHERERWVKECPDCKKEW